MHSPSFATSGAPSRTRIRARWSTAISIPATFSSRTRERFGFSTSVPHTPLRGPDGVRAERSIADRDAALCEPAGPRRPAARCPGRCVLARLRRLCASQRQTPLRRENRARGPGAAHATVAARRAQRQRMARSARGTRLRPRASTCRYRAVAGGFRLDHGGPAPAASADAGAGCRASASRLGVAALVIAAIVAALAAGLWANGYLDVDKALPLTATNDAASQSDAPLPQSDRSSSAAQAPSPAQSTAAAPKERATAPPPRLAAPPPSTIRRRRARRSRKPRRPRACRRRRAPRAIAADSPRARAARRRVHRGRQRPPAHP